MRCPNWWKDWRRQDSSHAGSIPRGCWRAWRSVVDLKKVETGSDATRFLFEKSFNRRAASEEQDTMRFCVGLRMRDEKVGSRKLELMREVRFRSNSYPVWKHAAIRSDTPGQIEDDQVIQKLRDSFLPRHLARFFFFDAERSQSLNLGQQDIVEGVSRILGLWTYAELENDLRHVISTKIPRVFSAAGGTDPETLLAELNGKVITAEGILRARLHEKDVLTRDLTEAKAELFEIEDSLKTLGAVDPVEMARSQERRTVLTEERAKLESKLKDAWEIALPLALLGNYRNELHSALIGEEKLRDWEAAKSSVEPKIPQVKADVFGDQPSEFILRPDQQSFYLERLEAALHRIFHPPPEGMPHEVYLADRNDHSAQIRALLASHQRELFDLAEKCVSIDRMDAELRELDQKLKQIQQNTAAFKRGTELHEERGQKKARIEQIESRLKDIDADIAKLETEVTALKRDETIQQEVAQRAQRGENLAALASKYREAAAEIRVRAANQMRKEISDEVGRLWIDIVGRGREFKGMEFDSHWQCWLLRRDGKKESWEDTNTSAGQRQVRMLAFYEALRRLAKLVPPLVVDTPLARLDKEVRASVLDELYLSGHQSIILSTNAEIDPDSELFDDIKGRLARVYTLHPRGREGSVNYEVEVANDYFGREI